MLTVWPADDHAILIAIGRHDQSPEEVYAALPDGLDLDVPEDERAKPPCCDKEGRPPAEEEVATGISDAIDHRARARRRAP